MRKITICFYIILILIVLQMVTVSATEETKTLHPIEDSYIEVDFRNYNYGDSVYLLTRGFYDFHDGDFTGAKSYLKFDLTRIPSSANIKSAELKLFLNTEPLTTSTVYVYYCSDNDWNELFINWNNAPSYETTPIDTYYPVDSEGWYSWIVTEAVKKSLSTRTLTLVLDEKEGITTNCEFYSKDFSDTDYDLIPSLNITYEYENPNIVPTASVTYYPSNPTTDDTIKFTDKSNDSDGKVVSWLWNFGDGVTSIEKNTTHKYSTAGTYNLILEATDDDGASDTTTRTITVSEPTTEPDDSNITGEDNNNNTNQDGTTKTPGFELILVICATAFVLFLKQKRK